MIGKANDIRVHTENEDYNVNLWLQDHPNVEVISIQFVYKPEDKWNPGREAFMIIYKEGEPNV
jgi:hypothetical protein